MIIHRRPKLAINHFFSILNARLRITILVPATRVTIGSLESLLNLEQKHEMVTAISVEVFPGVLQTEQKYIGKWREAIETEMNIRHSETYCRPSGARYLVGSTLAPMYKSRYPVHFVAVDVKSTRTIVDQTFSVPKCVRVTRMSEKVLRVTM